MGRPGWAATAIARAREYQGGSPLYLLIAWASRALLGPSELALRRAPSLVFGGLALLLLARLGARAEPANPDAGRCFTLAIVILGAAYVCLFLLGVRFLVMNTTVMPVFLVYALLLKRRIPFLTDWLPLLAGTILFDAIRGAIFVAAKLAPGLHVRLVVCLPLVG